MKSVLILAVFACSVFAAPAPDMADIGITAATTAANFLNTMNPMGEREGGKSIPKMGGELAGALVETTLNRPTTMIQAMNQLASGGATVAGKVANMINPMNFLSAMTAAGAGAGAMMGGGAQGFNPMAAAMQAFSMPMQAFRQFGDMANQAVSSFGFSNPFGAMTNAMTNGMSNGMSSMTNTASNMAGMNGLAGMASGMGGMGGMGGSSSSNSMALIPSGSQTIVTTTQTSTNTNVQKTCEDTLKAFKSGLITCVTLLQDYCDAMDFASGKCWSQDQANSYKQEARNWFNSPNNKCK